MRRRPLFRSERARVRIRAWFVAGWLAALGCAVEATPPPEEPVAPLSSSSAPDAAAPARPIDASPADVVEAADAGAWVVPARAYLDPTVRSASAAYAQDPWNERTRGVSGDPANPFFDGVFGCTSSAGTPTALDCPAKLSEKRTSKVRRIVLHNTLEGLADAVSIFSRNRPYFRTDRNYPVSIHHVVARDGTTVTMVPESRVAYHSGVPAVNGDAIGIELVANAASDPTRGHALARTWSKEGAGAVPFEAAGLTIPQYRSLLTLVARISATYAIPLSSVISHRSVSPGTSCPTSIWPHASFDTWRDVDLPRDIACAGSTSTVDAFAVCVAQTP